jgi:tRNA-splicing ligase RtcB
MSRHAARKRLPVEGVLQDLREREIYLRVKNRKLISEEAPGAYKDIDQVVDIAHRAGLARKVVRLRPLGVVKG